MQPGEQDTIIDATDLRKEAEMSSLLPVASVTADSGQFKWQCAEQEQSNGHLSPPRPTRRSRSMRTELQIPSS